MLTPGNANAPGYWEYETTGELRKSVAALLNSRPLTNRDVRLLRLYFIQWIDCPLWRGIGIEDLRDDARLISDAADISRWLRKAVAFGADPL